MDYIIIIVGTVTFALFFIACFACFVVGYFVGSHKENKYITSKLPEIIDTELKLRGKE